MLITVVITSSNRLTPVEMEPFSPQNRQYLKLRSFPV